MRFLQDIDILFQLDPSLTKYYLWLITNIAFYSDNSYNFVNFTEPASPHSLPNPDDRRNFRIDSDTFSDEEIRAILDGKGIETGSIHFFSQITFRLIRLVFWKKHYAW